MIGADENISPNHKTGEGTVQCLALYCDKISLAFPLLIVIIIHSV